MFRAISLLNYWSDNLSLKTKVAVNFTWEVRNWCLKLRNVPNVASEPKHTNFKDISLFKWDIWKINDENKIWKKWTDVSRSKLRSKLSNINYFLILLSITSEPKHTNFEDISLFSRLSNISNFLSILSEPKQIIKVILGICDSFNPIRQEYGSVIKKCHKVRIQAS